MARGIYERTEKHRAILRENIKNTFTKDAREKRRQAILGKPSWRKGKKSPSTTGIFNPSWKGDTATYTAKHIWISYNFGRPKTCEQCRFSSDKSRKLQWANISGRYLRIRSDWKRLCIPCHRKMDLHGEKIKLAINRKDIIIRNGRFVKKVKETDSLRNRIFAAIR